MATKKRTQPPVQSGFVASDLYIKRLYADGTSTVTHHRVWDGEKFFSSQLKLARAEGLEIMLSSKEYEEKRK